MRSTRELLCVAVAALVGVCVVGYGQEGEAASATATVDLSKAVIVTADGSVVCAKAGEFLQEEIEVRTGLRLECRTSAPAGDVAAILLGTVDAMPGGVFKTPPGIEVPAAAEGYALWVDGTQRPAPTVYLAGRDERGALFAAGRLLRLVTMGEGEVAVDTGVALATAPRYPLRGHQIGYRNTANSYDAWDLATFEQYTRDLIVFGGNCIELIPSLDPGEVDGPVMKQTIWEMTIQLSEMLASYDIDVWFWLPLDEDASKSHEASAALEHRRKLFESCVRIDHIMIPGGDPGHTPPRVLMPWLARLAGVLHDVHPEAGLWVSNQGFEQDENDDFFEYLEKKRPDWLAGVVYGPWAKMTLREVRDRTPEEYPIRRYPDITHCVRCQYPMPNWDLAFAHTLGREPVNPRPIGTAHIHNSLAPLSNGFLTYSDGCHDDVNKIVWTALGWDPEADVETILRDYGRYFIGEEHGDAVAQGLLALERNWEGPVRDNETVKSTLEHWQAIEKAADASVLANWRFQMALLRAYYDEYVRQRRRYEGSLEEAVLRELRNASRTGTGAAILAARDKLAEVETASPAPLLRRRIEELGEDLNQSIGMQLSVEKYGAKNPERGAVLDFLDQPLNNRSWLEVQLDHVLKSSNRESRLARIESILDWGSPGPGSFYDDLGNPWRQPHLVHEKSWEDDPGFVESAQCEYSKDVPGYRLSWLDQAQTLFEQPLRMRYTGLDSGATYRLRIVYTGRFRATMRLVANGDYEVHGPIPQPKEPYPMTFDIPNEVTSDGRLELEWQRKEGRGCQVAEVWLLRDATGSGE